MIAFLTIVLPNVLGYIKESLYLQTPTHFYKQPLDRPNITQIVNRITKPGFKDLDFLISKVRLISKTIIFGYDIDNRIALAIYL